MLSACPEGTLQPGRLSPSIASLSGSIGTRQTCGKRCGCSNAKALGRAPEARLLRVLTRSAIGVHLHVAGIAGGDLRVGRDVLEDGSDPVRGAESERVALIELRRCSSSSWTGPGRRCLRPGGRFRLRLAVAAAAGGRTGRGRSGSTGWILACTAGGYAGRAGRWCRAAAGAARCGTGAAHRAAGSRSVPGSRCPGRLPRPGTP